MNLLVQLSFFPSPFPSHVFSSGSEAATLVAVVVAVADQFAYCFSVGCVVCFVRFASFAFGLLCPLFCAFPLLSEIAFSFLLVLFGFVVVPCCRFSEKRISGHIHFISKQILLFYFIKT